MKKTDLKEFYRHLREQMHELKGELDYVNPYTLLVAVLLSAQARDFGVNKATGPLFKVVDTPEKMVALVEAKVRNYIKTTGLFNTKAKNVIALSKLLIAHHDSDVPRDREALEALPSVGRKTANVVLHIAFGEPTIAVDTYIFRIESNRSGARQSAIAVLSAFGLELFPDHLDKAVAPGERGGTASAQLDIVDLKGYALAVKEDIKDAGFCWVLPDFRAAIASDEAWWPKACGHGVRGQSDQLFRVALKIRLLRFFDGRPGCWRQRDAFYNGFRWVLRRIWYGRGVAITSACSK